MTLVPKCPRGASDPAVHPANDQILRLVGALRGAEPAAKALVRIHRRQPNTLRWWPLSTAYQGKGPPFA